MKHELNQQTRNSLFKKVGLTYEQMQQMDAEEIDSFIEKRIGKKLAYGFSKGHIVNRGSVYLSLKRLLPISKVDKALSKI